MGIDGAGITYNNQGDAYNSAFQRWAGFRLSQVSDGSNPLSAELANLGPMDKAKRMLEWRAEYRRDLPCSLEGCRGWPPNYDCLEVSVYD